MNIGPCMRLNPVISPIVTGHPLNRTGCLLFTWTTQKFWMKVYSTSHVLFLCFFLEPGSKIAPSWSPMRLKISHWRPEFHNWLPHFSIWRLKKIFHSQVGACLKKLISDPGNTLLMRVQHHIWSWFSLIMKVYLYNLCCVFGLITSTHLSEGSKRETSETCIGASLGTRPPLKSPCVLR